MKNYGNYPKYRGVNGPRLIPNNETQEERILRMLNTPVKTIKDNKAFLAALRATVKAEKK
jgi:hypothetical protein